MAINVHIDQETLEKFTTEGRNPASRYIDRMSSREIVGLINAEDSKVPVALQNCLDTVALLVDDIVTQMQVGGRLFYIGAGTSGRLGVLDASECPPTYGVSPELVQGIIAGGEQALTRSIEGAEDDTEAGVKELQARGFNKNDVLVGITASGQAPYVLGAMEYARNLSSIVGAISCNKISSTFALAKHAICAEVGPEVITGSTRMKAGTAQKLILNMISTAVMIRMGKVYENLMVDVRPVNRKLVERSKRLVRQATGCDQVSAERTFEAAGREPKIAIIMLLTGKSRDEAITLNKLHKGRIANIIAAINTKE